VFLFFLGAIQNYIDGVKKQYTKMPRRIKQTILEEGIVMILEISLAVVALAFVVLVFYLVQTLKTLNGSLDEIRGTMVQMKGELTQVSSEVKDVLYHTNQMAVDVRAKLQDLDPLFNSVNDVGKVVNDLTSTVRHSAEAVTSIIDKGNRKVQTANPSKISAIMNSIPVVIDIWRSLKSRKNQPVTTLSKLN
jgi:uncharacterized protein YoxC